MKVCKNCGAQNFDIKQNCDKCGYPLYEKGSHVTRQQVAYKENINTSISQRQPYKNLSVPKPKKPSGVAIAAEVFLILTNIVYDLCSVFFLFFLISTAGIDSFQIVTMEALIGLLSFLPFSIASAVVLAVYVRKMGVGEKVGTAFKVCTLLFINIIAGILMLCDNESNEEANVVVYHQPAAPAPTAPIVVKKDDKFDEVKKYKGLLENGVITQEEFENKKKELLGL